MTKQANKKVKVKLKDIKIKEGMPHLAEWIYKGKHQKWVSQEDLKRLQNGQELRIMTIHPPKHTTNTLEKKRRTK